MRQYSGGILYLLPSLLGNTDPDVVLPFEVQRIGCSLRVFFAEDIRSARRFLRQLDPKFPIDESSFFLLNKNTGHKEWEEMLQIVVAGADAAVISEAGLPAVADPGSGLIQSAHKQMIRVVPLTGPSSILLALMASGLNGQNFAFNGYLPIEEKERNKTIRILEENSGRFHRSEIFMETPYRNNKLLLALLKICRPGTKLCIAANITTAEEYICTRRMAEWKDHFPDLHKQPAIFILESAS